MQPPQYTGTACIYISSLLCFPTGLQLVFSIKYSKLPSEKRSSSSVSLSATVERRRIAHACEICRIRKTRCDGRNPCSTCVENNEDCGYREISNLAQSKTDVILETLLQLRSDIGDVRQKLDRPAFQGPQLPSPLVSFAQSPSVLSTASPSNPDFFAIIPPSHISATEKFLSWEIFDNVPMLRTQFVSTFKLESRRPPVPISSSDMGALAATIRAEDWKRLIIGFGRNINFWYPALRWQQIDSLFPCLGTQSLDGCLAMLIVSLGDACMYVEQRYQSDNLPSEGGGMSISCISNTVDGSACFESAYQMIHVAMAEMNVTALQCLFYTAVYFSYLQRPLQTNAFLNAAAQKCLALLRYSTSSMTPEEYECVKRVFWCCFILESDIIVELEDVPQSGCSSMESQVPLPAKFDTHATSDTSDLSTLYFLACISIRRLLNRIHKLLYSQESVARMHKLPDMNLISELAHQLEEWRTVLPPYLKFELSNIDEPPTNSYQGFLRQRYLAAKSVIFRPVFNFVVTMNLRKTEPPEISDLLANAEQCIDAVVLHMTNLRGFTHTVVIDTWICSLSMTGVVLVLFIAWKTPSLKKVLEEKFGMVWMKNEVVRLEDRLHGFMRTSPEISPSVSQCVEMIGVVRELIWSSS